MHSAPCYDINGTETWMFIQHAGIHPDVCVLLLWYPMIEECVGNW